jgi:ASC-1-like (ASCH) protein
MNMEALLQQQTPTPDTATPSEPKPADDIESLRKQLAEKENALTSRFDGLTRRERMLLQRENELKTKYSSVQSFEDLKKLAEKEPLNALEKLGLNYDKLTDIYVNMSTNGTEEKSVGNIKAEIEELKRKMEEQASEGQMKEIMRVKNAKLGALQDLAKRENSEYSLVAHFGVYDDVLNYMSEHYNSTGEILDDESALKHVEQRLVDNLKGLANNPKIKALFGIKEPEENTPKPDASFTLSDSKFNSGAPKNESTRGLSDQQLFELALSKIPSMK